MLRAVRYKVWFPVEGKNFYLLQIVQTGFEGHTASYSGGVRKLFIGKRPEREVNYAPTSSVEFKELYLHGVDRK
jgi:hypothetical protein